MKSILCVIFLLGILFCQSTLAQRQISVRYADNSIFNRASSSSSRAVGPNMEDLVSVYCADATNFDGSVYVYNRCACPIVVQLGITVGYWSTDFNVTNVVIPGWSPSLTSSSNKPNNAIFLFSDPDYESYIEVFAVNPYQTSAPCQPFAMGCLSLTSYTVSYTHLTLPTIA